MRQLFVKWTILLQKNDVFSKKDLKYTFFLKKMLLYFEINLTFSLKYYIAYYFIQSQQKKSFIKDGLIKNKF
ncbi:MAG: hypothetical protein DWQ02_28100 [Bacteroidetes bacterium]|nr:MAG: hypothetical protein DWQ02_28100 [Bacteroidota bacterium]